MIGSFGLYESDQGILIVELLAIHGEGGELVKVRLASGDARGLPPLNRPDSPAVDYDVAGRLIVDLPLDQIVATLPTLDLARSARAVLESLDELAIDERSELDRRIRARRAAVLLRLANMDRGALIPSLVEDVLIVGAISPEEK